MRLEGDDGGGGGGDESVGEVDYVQRQVLVPLLLLEGIAEDEQARAGENKVPRRPEVFALLLSRTLFEAVCYGNEGVERCEVPVGEAQFVGVNVLYMLIGWSESCHSKS